jgi:hypothetical protein
MARVLSTWHGGAGDVVAIPHQGHSHGPQGKADGEGFGAWTLATGIVYGLQPDALFVIVPALALPTRLAAAAYILMFVFGTVAAMGSYTAVIGARLPWFNPLTYLCRAQHCLFLRNLFPAFPERILSLHLVCLILDMSRIEN